MALLAGCVSACSFAVAVELLIRLSERIGIMDWLMGLFGLTEESEKKSAPDAATSEGTKVIYIGDIIPQYTEVVKEEMR